MKIYRWGDPTDENNVRKIRDHSFSALIVRSRKHILSSISGTDECKKRNHLINDLLIAVWGKDEDNTSNAIVGIITIIITIIIITHQIESPPKYK